MTDTTGDARYQRIIINKLYKLFFGILFQIPLERNYTYIPNLAFILALRTELYTSPLVQSRLISQSSPLRSGLTLPPPLTSSPPKLAGNQKEKLTQPFILLKRKQKYRLPELIDWTIYKSTVSPDILSYLSPP